MPRGVKRDPLTLASIRQGFDSVVNLEFEKFSSDLDEHKTFINEVHDEIQKNLRSNRYHWVIMFVTLIQQDNFWSSKDTKFQACPCP